MLVVPPFSGQTQAHTSRQRERIYIVSDEEPELTDADDAQKFHHAFSAQAHNRATDILYSDVPSPSDVEDLVELAHVARWHWQSRDDKTIQNVAVSLWLLSRAYSANGLGANALDYAQRSL
jgi:hypothetical protein